MTWESYSQGISCVSCFNQLSRQIQELKPFKNRKKPLKKSCSSLLQNCNEYAFKKWEEKISNIKLSSNVLQPLINMFMPNSKLDILILDWKHLFLQVEGELPYLQKGLKILIKKVRLNLRLKKYRRTWNLFYACISSALPLCHVNYFYYRNVVKLPESSPLLQNPHPLPPSDFWKEWQLIC